MSKKWETVHCGPCCQSIKQGMHETNSSNQGMHEVELTSLTTGKSRRAGIALRRPDNSVVFINFCPFCGARHEAQV